MLISPEGRRRSARIDIVRRNIHSIEKKQFATCLNVLPMILKPEKPLWNQKGFPIEARYPDEKKSFYDQCTEVFAYEMFSEMEKLYKCLIQKSTE